MQLKIMLLFNLSENGNFAIKKFKFLYKNNKFDEVIDVSAIHLLLLWQKYEISNQRFEQSLRQTYYCL